MVHCFTISANLTLTELPSMRSLLPIECPGDVVSFRCSVHTNSENPQITWQITPPAFAVSEVITYNGSSILGLVDVSPLGIARVTLTQFANISTVTTYIESVFEIMLLPDIQLNQTFLQCSTENLSNDSLYVDFNTSG